MANGRLLKVKCKTRLSLFSAVSYTHLDVYKRQFVVRFIEVLEIKQDTAQGLNIIRQLQYRH